jgi:hypothetical protein
MALRKGGREKREKRRESTGRLLLQAINVKRDIIFLPGYMQPLTGIDSRQTVPD